MSHRSLHPDNAAQADYWNGVVGHRWSDHQEHQDELLKPISERLLAVGGREAGRAGDRRRLRLRRRRRSTSQPASRPAGEVLGLDISEPMLARARERVPPDLPARFVLADATVLRTGARLSRSHRVALRRHVLRRSRPNPSPTCGGAFEPGGRLAFACWREARQNPWMIVPLREAAKHAPPLPEMDPEDPGPFAFADEARVRRILSEAGFADIVVDAARPRSRHRHRPRARRGRGGRVGDRSDEPDAGRPERGCPRRCGGGHSRRARRPDGRRQRAARRGDLDGDGREIPSARSSRARRNARMVKAACSGRVAVLRADRAGPSREAAARHAVRARRALQMRGAGGDVVAIGRKRSDRTGARGTAARGRSRKGSARLRAAGPRAPRRMRARRDSCARDHKSGGSGRRSARGEPAPRAAPIAGRASSAGRRTGRARPRRARRRARR